MKSNVLTIENKKYVLLPNDEYLSILQDIADLKKVFSRKNEKGTEANSFFNIIKKGK